MFVLPYLEAVGVMSALRSGVAIDSVRRPIPATNVSIRPPENLCRPEEDLEEDLEDAMESIP